MNQEHDVRTTDSDQKTIDRRGLHVLDLRTCLTRLAARPVGRVAMFDRGSIVILPVNHVVDGMTIGFRTTTGTKLFHAIHGSEVGFEVNEFDADTRTGWSILVQGTAALASDAETLRLHQLASCPWTSGTRRWVVIHPHEISGRELLLDPNRSNEISSEDS
jgi:nitroimidazol reductase NimA-like FMN-containing flavoprotein (pyridoxamine 5'-phosphate oxidase superfamily)